MGILPPHLTLIKHSVNKRQGGARNTAVRAARGTYIQYLDHDDALAPGSLKAVADILRQNPGLDILFCDYEEYRDGEITRNKSYINNSRNPMIGREFFRTQSIPWTPWQYIYRREFLVENDLWQVEGHLFEDADYVLKATLAASRMLYEPCVILRYSVGGSQTTRLRRGDDHKIEDMFYLNERVRRIAAEWEPKDAEIARSIYHQHFFRYRSCVLRYLWRARYGTIRRILRDFPVHTPVSDPLLALTARHPALFAFGLQCAKPILPLLRRLYMRHRSL